MCIRVYVYMCICIYVYMCICVYVYMCIYVYVYMCICRLQHALGCPVRSVRAGAYHTHTIDTIPVPWGLCAQVRTRRRNRCTYMYTYMYICMYVSLAAWNTTLTVIIIHAWQMKHDVYKIIDPIISTVYIEFGFGVFNHALCKTYIYIYIETFRLTQDIWKL